jgi:hypothetical protein
MSSTTYIKEELLVVLGLAAWGILRIMFVVVRRCEENRNVLVKLLGHEIILINVKGKLTTSKAEEEYIIPKMGSRT